MLALLDESRRCSQYQGTPELQFLHQNKVHPKRNLLAGASLGVLVIAAGCSKARSEDANAAKRPPAGAPVAGPGGQAGGAGARGGQTLTLAPTDVSIARTTSMSEGVPITGNLRPIETVSVRARLEGDLEGIYVREGM